MQLCALPRISLNRSRCPACAASLGFRTRRRRIGPAQKYVAVAGHITGTDGECIRLSREPSDGRLVRQVCHFWCLGPIQEGSVNTALGWTPGKMAELLMKSAIATLARRCLEHDQLRRLSVRFELTNPVAPQNQYRQLGVRIPGYDSSLNRSS